MNEYTRAAKFVTTTLGGDSTLATYAPGGIWQGIANDLTPMPYIVFGWQGASDVTNVEQVRLWANILMRVLVIGPAGSYATIAQAADRIDTLLQKVQGSTSDSTILACYRQQSINLETVANSLRYSHLGGIYRVLVQGN